MCDICLKSGIFTDIPTTGSCVISVLNQEYSLISLLYVHGQCDICLKPGIFTDIPTTRSCVICLKSGIFTDIPILHGHV